MYLVEHSRVEGILSSTRGSMVYCQAHIGRWYLVEGRGYLVEHLRVECILSSTRGSMVSC